MRLLEHRAEHIANQRLGPLMRTEDLTDEESRYIRDCFIQRLAGNIEGDITVQQMRDAYISVLSDHGVMCPHPELSQSFMRGYQHCELCGCAVLSPR